MSSADARHATEFDAWLQDLVVRHGEFTVLIVLMQIGERSVVPLCSTYAHVIGDEADWHDMKAMLAGSGRSWDGVAFFPTKGEGGGPVDAATARSRLAELDAKVIEDRMVLNDGHFFDSEGRRIEIEPVMDA